MQIRMRWVNRAAQVVTASHRALRLAGVALALGLGGCGGGAGGGSTTGVASPVVTTNPSGSPAAGSTAPPTTPAPAPVVTAPLLPAGKLGAARFLTQATFGPTLAEVEALRDATSYDAWFAEQAAKPISLQLPLLQQRKANGETVYQNQRVSIWWQNAVQGQDQLRQRMAFALSEIFVVSDQSGPLQNDVEGMGNYYDMLSRNALGNYRTLLGEVTLSVPMGHYLSMLRNQKPNVANGIRADENYAREVMQLCTIGLVQLNLDGTPKLDSNGLPLPTFKQPDIEGLARVFTGWGSQHETASDPDWKFLYGTLDGLRPMEAWPSYHDVDAKTILNGTSIPAGMRAEDELKLALDVIFNHPNVGPFISRQLIQRLVTSNPSPAYVQRVATVFNDNGAGVRGDLLAVAKAILTDSEARSGNTSNPQGFGKIREPMLRTTQLWRFFNAVGKNGRYDKWSPETEYSQAPLRANSVFNFFRPDYRPVGAITNAGLVCPECQITNEASITNLVNEMDNVTVRYTWSGGAGRDWYDQYVIPLDFTPWEARVSDANLPALVDDLNIVLLGGRMSADYRAALIDYVKLAPDAGNKLYDLALNISSSAQFALQQ